MFEKLSQNVNAKCFIPFQKLKTLACENKNGKERLKVQCHKMLCQLRPLTYSLGLDIALRISFTLEKSRVKNIRRFKQGASRCKMAGARFHSFAKLRAQIFNPAMAYRGVLSADCHNKNGRTADCKSSKSTFESGLPQA
jgi:hypothetical protein